MKKLSPSVKLRKEVSEFIERLQDVDSAEDVLTQLVQLSTQLDYSRGPRSPPAGPSGRRPV